MDLDRVSQLSLVVSFLYYIYISEVVERGGLVDVIFTDFENTFDTVDHGLLFREFKYLNIKWCTFRCFLE